MGPRRRVRLRVTVRQRAQHLGAAPPDDPYPAAAAPALSLCRLCLLGGCIWWVTRRLYGNLGGYTALALYCFSPAVLKACVAPNPEVLAALGVFGGVYTCIGVAHSMPNADRPARKPGPPATGLRRWGGKWRPRIVLLIVIFGVAAAAHIAALPVAALLGLAAMIWIAEGHRSQALPVVLVALGRRPRPRLCLLRLLARRLQLRLPLFCRISLVLDRSRPPLLFDASPTAA